MSKLILSPANASLKPLCQNENENSLFEVRIYYLIYYEQKISLIDFTHQTRSKKKCHKNLIQILLAALFIDIF